MSKCQKNDESTMTFSRDKRTVLFVFLGRKKNCVSFGLSAIEKSNERLAINRERK